MSADMMHFGGDTWLVTFAKKLGRVGGTDRVIEKLRKIFFTENLGEKPNIKFFTVDPYFWAMSFVGLSKSAEYDIYC